MTIALLAVTRNKSRKPRPKPRRLLGFLRPRSTTSILPPIVPLNLFLILHGVDQAATRYALVIFLCDGLLKVNKQLKNDALGRFFAIASFCQWKSKCCCARGHHRARGSLTFLMRRAGWRSSLLVNSSSNESCCEYLVDLVLSVINRINERLGFINLTRSPSSHKGSHHVVRRPK